MGRFCINSLGICSRSYYVSLPMTSNWTLALSSPSLLTALQIYVPASSAPADGIISSPFLASALLGRSKPSLSQVMIGVGIPEALQRNSAFSPSITVS